MSNYVTSGSQSTKDNVFLRVNDQTVGWHSRPIRDLVMIRGAKGYCWLFWRDGSQYIMAYPLKHYESMLPLSQYIRIHQNSMVNMDFVEKVQLTHKGPQLSLDTGQKLSISRRRWTSVKQTLLHLIP